MRLRTERVEKRQAIRGRRFTSIIHGKYWHEETRATASQALHAGDGRYLIVLDRDEAVTVCDYIRCSGTQPRSLRASIAPPHRDSTLTAICNDGCANQTTMLSSESLEVGEMLKQAMRGRYGDEALPERFRAFDTICSATQDRQDAVKALLNERQVDLMVVIGGLNSSNTCNLARICAQQVPTYHIADPGGLLSSEQIRHKPVDPLRR